MTAKGVPAAIGDGEANELPPSGTTADVASWLPMEIDPLWVSRIADRLQLHDMGSTSDGVDEPASRGKVPQRGDTNQLPLFGGAK